MPEIGSSGGDTVAEVNLKFIWDVVSQLSVGKAGYAYVVDSSGQLIAHPDITRVLQRTDVSRLPQVRAAITRGEDRPLDLLPWWSGGTSDLPPDTVVAGDRL